MISRELLYGYIGYQQIIFNRKRSALIQRRLFDDFLRMMA